MRNCSLFFLILFLTACVTTSKRPLETVVADLSRVDVYQATGKMSFSNGRDGGTGRFNWLSDRGFVVASLKAPLGSKSWTITETISGAEMTTHNGEQYFADSAQTLISQQLGWQVPWQPLKSWIIGHAYKKNNLASSSKAGELVLNEMGWQIKYSQFKMFNEQNLPTKIIARKGPYSIKISIKAWTW